MKSFISSASARRCASPRISWIPGTSTHSIPALTCARTVTMLRRPETEIPAAATAKPMRQSSCKTFFYEVTKMLWVHSRSIFVLGTMPLPSLLYPPLPLALGTAPQSSLLYLDQTAFPLRMCRQLSFLQRRSIDFRIFIRNTACSRSFNSGTVPPA